MIRFKRTRHALLALALVGGSLHAVQARAQDDDAVEESETVTGKAPKAQQGGGKKSDVPPVFVPQRPEGAPELSREEALARPYPNQLYLGAEALQLDAGFMGKCFDGTRLVYNRRYKEAKKFWDNLENEAPGYAIGHVGAVLIYQAMMMENFDFKWERQYLFHNSRAIEQLDASIEAGEEGLAFKNFLVGAMMGVESIHIMRKGDFVPALARGVEAMGYINEVKELAPNFVDPYLGDGLYKYWRSVVTMNSKVLPDFEDQRAAGIADMEAVEKHGVFLGPGASLGLAFTYIEERDMKTALSYCLKNYRDFPDNVINNLVLSRVYMYLRRYDESIRVLDEILADAPDNQRAHYYYATVYLRTRDYDKAEAAVDRYLTFTDLEPYFRAQGLSRKGDVYYQRKDYDAAERYYKEALKVDNYKPAQAKLDRIKRMRKDGKI